ncbi:MAG: elongation factor G [Gammaproteobacteria bacterium]|nr:elongation factor G [Gammaproteobacteria bacterium]
MGFSTENIRNIALVGAASTGKTLLCEQLLTSAGAIVKAGSIEQRDTVSDHDEREKERQHSLNPTVVSFDHDDTHINLLDTPGANDFIGRAIAVLPAVETVAIVVDASVGVDAYINKIKSKLDDRHLCQLVIVNKIDRSGVDLEQVVEQIQSVLGSECLPINLPSNNGANVVDCFFNSEESDTDISSIAEAHEKIIEQVVEVDEDLMELYFENGADDLPADKLHETFEAALAEGHLIPICFTSATTGAGISDLLSVIDKLMPNPVEANAAPFYTLDGEEQQPIEIAADAEAPMLAHTFMVQVDPFKGRLGVIRLHRGKLAVGNSFFHGTARKATRVAHILKLQGAKQTEVDSVSAGDIFAIPRAEGLEYNSMLHESHDEESVYPLKIELPSPAYARALVAEDDKAAQKMSDGLHRVSSEDPSIEVEHVAAANETVLSCLGEIHLREVLARIEDQYGVKIQTEFPAIPYRETITGKAEGHHRHKKQSGGAGQFGEVYLRVEPLPRGDGFEFVDQVVNGVIPGQFIPAVEKGVSQMMVAGSVSGNQMQDIRVTVYDGKHHSVDSKEIAFVQAGKKAFMDAVSKAKPVVMEPIVEMHVNVPSENMGDVAGDLSSMGGMVNGSNMLTDGSTEIVGQVPLREAQTYHSRLSSLSGGKGSYSMHFSHYAAVQPQLQKELMNAYQPIEDE